MHTRESPIYISLLLFFFFSGYCPSYGSDSLEDHGRERVLRSLPKKPARSEINHKITRTMVEEELLQLPPNLREAQIRRDEKYYYEQVKDAYDQLIHSQLEMVKRPEDISMTYSDCCEDYLISAKVEARKKLTRESYERVIKPLEAYEEIKSCYLLYQYYKSVNYIQTYASFYNKFKEKSVQAYQSYGFDFFDKYDQELRQDFDQQRRSQNKPKG